MLTLRSIRQVRTSRSVKSFRSVGNSTGVWMAHLDRARMGLAEARRRPAEEHRLWLIQQ